MTVCRLCYNSSGIMVPLFVRICNDAPLCSKVMAIADVNIFADDGGSKFLCQKCAHQVEQSYLLKRKCEVVMRAEEGWNVQCCFCGVETLSCGDLETHIKVTHCPKETFCTACNESFPFLSLYLIHCLRLHRRPVYICDECGLKFQHLDSLENHLKIHERNIMLQCKVCDKQFRDEHAWNEHVRGHNAENCNELCYSEEEVSKVPTIGANASSNVYSCRFCNEVFDEMKTMIYHVTIFHKDGLVHRCNKCQTVIAKDAAHECKPCNSVDTNEIQDCTELSPPSSPPVRKAKLHQCPYCLKKFKGKSTWDTHVRTHTGELPYVCSQCNRGFRQKSNLMMHMFRNHKPPILPPLEPMPFTMEPPTYLLQSTYTIDPSHVFEHLDVDYSTGTPYQ